MKLYIYFFRSLIGLIIIFLLSLYWAFSSAFATKWLAQKIADFTPISIESIEGNLRDGLQITNLNHLDFALKKGEISLNWSALLRGKLHLNSLQIQGLHVNENLLKDSNETDQNGGIKIPFDEFQIDSLYVSLETLIYDEYTLQSLKIEGKNLYYAPKKSPRGDMDIAAKTSLGDIELSGSLGEIINASGSFIPSQIPNELTLKNPIIFSAKGDTKALDFMLKTDSLEYNVPNLPLSFQTPQIEGKYHFKNQTLNAKLNTIAHIASAKIALDGNFSMGENDPKTLLFSLDANAPIDKKSLATLASSFEVPFLETMGINEPIVLHLEGNQTRVDYVLNIPHIGTNKAEFWGSKIAGIASLDSIEGNFASNLTVVQIQSNLEGYFKMDQYDVEKLFFEIQSQSNLQEYLDSILFSQISGNMKSIDFVSALKPTSYDDIFINEFTLKGNANQDYVDFSLTGDFAYEQDSLNIKVDNANLDYANSPIKLAFSPQIELNNKPLIFLEELQILLSILPDNLAANLVSKYLDLNTTYDFENQIAGSLHVKPFEPNIFTQLPKSINLHNVQAKGEFSYNKNIDADLKILLNDLPLKLKVSGSMEDLDLNLVSQSFNIAAKYAGADTGAKLKIANLKDFLKSLQPFINQEFPQIEGPFEMDVSQKDGQIFFNAKSNSIDYQDQSLHNIAIAGNFENNLITLSRLNFGLDAGLGLDSIQSFSLIKQGTYDINSTNLSLDFKGLSIQSTLKPQISANIKTDEFFLSHPQYGEGIISGALQIKQNGSNISIGGEINTKKIKAHYKPSGFSIHTDKDIIIVDHNASTEEDFFTRNIALDLAIIVDDVHYKEDEINLKTSGIFYLKKDPTKLLEFYGSILDINGDVVTLGKKFEISASNLYFRGYNPVDPVLDILALYKHQETDITIRITGTQSNPRVYLSSNPLMSQRDIFSILVFGTRFGDSQDPHSQQNRTTQASLFLVNELSKDYLQALGLDILMFEYNPNSGTIDTTIGKEITDKTTLMLKNESEGGSAIIQQKLSPKWKLELGVGSESQSIDIIHKKKY